MQLHTIRQLNALNRQFYREQATSWQNSRQYAWPSWQQFLAHSQLNASAPITVADLGCGHGRLAHFLAENWTKATYTGFDLASPLLEIAKANAPAQMTSEFEEWDVVETLLTEKPLLPQRYDLIAVFGLLHHLPSAQLRQQFLLRLREHLTPRGEIWLTLWVPHLLQQPKPASLSRKVVSRHTPIDFTDLETGDDFLGWRSTSAIRYVHWLDQDEIQTLCQTPGLQVVAQWPVTEQGERGNLCFLLRGSLVPENKQPAQKI